MEAIKNFCQNLQYLRKVHGLSKKEMAKVLGVSVQKLSKMENCEPDVRIHAVHVCRVCDHFHKSSDEMLFENWAEMLTGEK